MSFAPHFVALFDAEEVLIDDLTWENFREGSQFVWDFLAKHEIGNGTDLSFIGGVSGPGGFSTLRVGGAIINALAHRFKLPVHQARADLIARDLIGSDDFVLNSFGDGVFIPDGDKLVRKPVSEIATDKPLFTHWLPENKREVFKALPIDKDIMITTFQVLKKQASRRLFLPDYEFPAVKN